MSIKNSAARMFRSGLTLISPKLNTMVTYRAKFGKRLDLKNPKTLNEKILWLKFNDYYKNPLIKQCADKYRVREYITQIGCPEILNNLIGAFDDVEKIKWDKLPNSFALKLNVGCGYNIIVRNKTELNIEETKKILKKWLTYRFQYLGYSEMQYKGVKPIILIEDYLKPKVGLLPEDYKFYCFDGYAPYVMVCTDRQEGGKHPRYWYYNEQWEMQMLSEDALKYGKEASIQKPNGIELAFEYASKLSRGFPFVRVDLYLVDGRVFFGELTFTPSGGQDNGRLPDADKILGDYVNRP
ncbi:MAG: glycosyl transferase [Christensenellaceae bacterium]|nr:glycosyl transferase [Christensenellaceae bacterium]